MTRDRVTSLAQPQSKKCADGLYTCSTLSATAAGREDLGGSLSAIIGGGTANVGIGQCIAEADIHGRQPFVRLPS